MPQNTANEQNLLDLCSIIILGAFVNALPIDEGLHEESIDVILDISEKWLEKRNARIKQKAGKQNV